LSARGRYRARRADETVVGVIEVNELTKRYGDTTAVRNLTFQVRPGHVTGFLGPNGAGKTTTLRMLLGLIGPTGGSATIDGQPFRRHPRGHYYGGFLDEHTVIAGTSEADEEYGAGRHWLVDVRDMRLLGEITYPFPISGVPGPLADGSWYTVAEDTKELQVWRLADV
jgi:energy-coupling factor transporter ATP-binding protein EcfA2